MALSATSPLAPLPSSSTADVSTADSGRVNVIGNAGLLRKTGGTGTTTIANGVSFVNTGTLDAQNGNLTLQGAYTLAGGMKMNFRLGWFNRQRLDHPLWRSILQRKPHR